ncbi:family 43 glycosylhydrolase [Sphingomonas morindae]|uniref:Family 43 glycosylhydrolase n=1 Tax=Sphingomonas morindae TaxID=1541170 RepID=A0ABY4XDC2_9SPHN|nr:family 43 glycosylhydrolase [Sphingomonas morindae]USI74972.1 family 43 glycosylhydrolase [Sphingomonas morindae]
MPFRSAFALALALTVAAAPAPVAHNPVFAGADPDIVALCGRWYVYPTDSGDAAGGYAATRIYAYASPDLRHWTRSAPVLTMQAIPWVNDDHAPSHGLWAPSLTAAHGRYYLYYSIGPQNPTPSRIGVAVADRPEGPFTDSGRPLLTGGQGFEAIDPMVFIDPKSGTPYLYAGGSAGATLRIFALKPDMTEIAREIPVKTPPFFTEGAFVHERNGLYYLSYSHGHWNGPDYSVHYATAPTPVGPWTYRGRILAGDARHQGPGHHAFAMNPKTGQWVIAYHRWQRGPGPGPYQGTRQVAIDRIRYDSTGAILPVVMTDGAPPASPLPPARCGAEARR